MRRRAPVVNSTRPSAEPLVGRPRDRSPAVVAFAHRPSTDGPPSAIIRRGLPHHKLINVRRRMVIVNRLWLAGVAASLTLAATTSAQQRPNAPGGRGGAAAASEPAEAGVPAVEKSLDHAPHREHQRQSDRLHGERRHDGRFATTTGSRKARSSTSLTRATRRTCRRGPSPSSSTAARARRRSG